VAAVSDDIEIPTRIEMPVDRLNGWPGFDFSKPDGPASQYMDHMVAQLVAVPPPQSPIVSESADEILARMREFVAEHEAWLAREHRTILVPACWEQAVKDLVATHGAGDRFAVRVLPGMADDVIYVVKDGLLTERPDEAGGS
jgi:hypothetical protein